MFVRRSLWGVAALLVTTFAATSAHAGGFEIPDNGARAVGRGGAFAVRADDLTAILHNPGGLSRLRGTRFLYSHNLIWEPVSFERAPSSLKYTDPYPPTRPESLALTKVENQDELFPLGMMAALSSDFGLDDWTFALGIFGPNAVGHVQFPVAGGQRYMLTSTDILLIYYSLAVAYGQKDLFGVGLTLQYVDMPSTEFNLVIDATPGGALNPYYSSADVEASLQLADHTAFTAIVGGWWRIIPELEVAVSGRVIPVYLDPEGEVVLHNVPGQATFTPQQLGIKGSHARLPLTMPIIVRGGLRYRYVEEVKNEEGVVTDEHEVFDIETNVVYESWSMLDAYNVELDGESNLFTAAPLPDLKINKAWRDTVSVRLGGTWDIVRDTFGVSLGGYWERGAVPDAYTHLDFLSFDRYALGGGLRFTQWGLDFSVSYNHVFQEDRDVSESTAKVYQQRPLSPCPGSTPCGGGNGVPANAGHYESSFDILAFGVEIHFDEWF